MCKQNPTECKKQVLHSASRENSSAKEQQCTQKTEISQLQLLLCVCPEGRSGMCCSPYSPAGGWLWIIRSKTDRLILSGPMRAQSVGANQCRGLDNPSSVHHFGSSSCWGASENSFELITALSVAWHTRLRWAMPWWEEMSSGPQGPPRHFFRGMVVGGLSWNTDWAPDGSSWSLSVQIRRILNWDFQQIRHSLQRIFLPWMQFDFNRCDCR